MGNNCIFTVSCLPVIKFQRSDVQIFRGIRVADVLHVKCEVLSFDSCEMSLQVHDFNVYYPHIIFCWFISAGKRFQFGACAKTTTCAYLFFPFPKLVFCGQTFDVTVQTNANVLAWKLKVTNKTFLSEDWVAYLVCQNEILKLSYIGQSH